MRELQIANCKLQTRIRYNTHPIPRIEAICWLFGNIVICRFLAAIHAEVTLFKAKEKNAIHIKADVNN